MTWRLREEFPGRLLSAEVTPENPQSVHELGFDSVWVHSGYFDIIQQHRALGRGHHGMCRLLVLGQASHYIIYHVHQLG